MGRVTPLSAAVVVLMSLAGCKTTGMNPETTGEPSPGLLIGPDAIGKAAPPADLPVKDTAKLCLRAADEFEKKGQTEEAIRLYEKARSGDPASAKSAGRRLAVLYDRAGDFGKSTVEYEQLVKDNPKDANLLNDLGYSHYCRGDWANAETCLGKAVQLDPNHKRAWVNLGLARAQQAKWDESYQAFCKAVRPADAHCNLAFVLGAQGHTEEAKAQYRQALALDPGMQLAQGALARLENPAPAITAAKKAKFDPEEAAAQIPTIAELETRLVKEGKLPPLGKTPSRTTAASSPTPIPVP